MKQQANNQIAIDLFVEFIFKMFKLNFMSNIMTIAENNKKLSRLWLFQSVGALALSGFFAIFLVMARSPQIGKLLPYKDFFKTSLTIHVNLSVLIWLTSIICTIFATNTKFLKAGYAGLVLCATGSVIIAGSIFDISAEAFLNNYIPMLNSDIFKLGIIIYFAGFIIASFQALQMNIQNKILGYFNISSFFIIIAGFITLALTLQNLELPKNKDLYDFSDYYEKLFWGFGHMIQFLYVNGMLMALFLIIKIKESKFTTTIKISCFLLNLIFALTGIYIIVNFDVTSFEYVNNFTRQMIMFAGIAPVLALFIIIPAIRNLASTRPQRNAVIWAMILFAAGGVISMMINGVNTIIPAHYHGSIIGISLSLMALTYALMPKLGYGEIKGQMANMQPILYGSGQLLHIIGFAISGGYGAMRKAPGMELPVEAKLYMGLMGIGGLISIIGGLFFVIIIFKCVTRGVNTNQEF